MQIFPKSINYYWLRLENLFQSNFFVCRLKFEFFFLTSHFKDVNHSVNVLQRLRPNSRFSKK
jgi:hypothetical protein